MTQRQHMTYRILCTVSENGNVLLIPLGNLMFHDESLAMYLKFLRCKMFDTGGSYEWIAMDFNVSDIDRIRAEKLEEITFPDILWIQYWSQHAVHVNPNYYDRGSANNVDSIINEYQVESEE